MKTARVSQRWYARLATAVLLVAGTGLATEETTIPSPALSSDVASPPPLRGRTVALDAGHEPPFASTDCGRCRWMGSGRSSHFFDVRWSYPGNRLSLPEGPYQGALAEYALNQDLVRRVALLLRQAGATVALTRIGRSAEGELSTATTDTLVGGDIQQKPLSAAELSSLVTSAATRNPHNVRPVDAAYRAANDGESAVRSLENVLARGERANRAGADLAVVVHADAVNNSGVRGRLLFVYHPGNPQEHDPAYLPPPDSRSLRLAKAIETELEATGGIPLSGLYGRDLWYLSTAAMPAVLIEVGRLTSRTDADWLSVDANRQATAAAIAKGIEAFLSHP